MANLQHLNAFISERLTAAAVEIFGAVEKTLTEYQGEMSRSKQEIDHLRTLVLWPEVKLHRSAGHQVSPHCCDPEASPEEEWSPDVSSDHHSTLHIKEEHDQRGDQRGPFCRYDNTVSLQFVNGEGQPPHLYRILAVEQTAGIKDEPDGDELITSPSTREARIPCGINPESSGLQRETLKDPLEITHHELNGLDEQQCTQEDWSPCQDPDPPRIKGEKFIISSPQEDTDHYYELPPQSENRVYDEPHSSSCGHEKTLSKKTFYTAEEKRRDAVGESCKLKEGVVTGEWIKALTPTGTRKKKGHDSKLRSKKRDGIEVEEDVNYPIRERRHTCPICAKRFKESGHLKDHVRIHTGEKPYQCKECGVNFRQSGALTLHMRIHTGERPYQCTDCGRRFNRKGDMETHRVTHTGERPHLCLVCGKSFKRKGNLNTHLKIHAEEKIH